MPAIVPRRFRNLPPITKRPMRPGSQQAKPEREERNAEMAGTGPPLRYWTWERRVGARLGEVRFVYLPRFNTTLSGRVSDNGSFKASARLRRGFIQMTGRIQGNNITAYIVSPSCNYTFQ